MNGWLSPKYSSCLVSACPSLEVTLLVTLPRFRVELSLGIHVSQQSHKDGRREGGHYASPMDPWGEGRAWG